MLTKAKVKRQIGHSFRRLLSYPRKEEYLDGIHARGYVKSLWF